MPKISVIIPAYNNKESFLRAFNSILKQEYSDYEIIITDDSNNDDIGNFIADINSPKTRYFKNKTSLGAPGNWNEGIKHSNGEYLKILHHDDWFSGTDGLEKFVNLLDENPNCIFGYSKSVDVNINTGVKKHRHAEKYVKSLSKNFPDLLYRNRIGAPSVTV